MESVAAEASSSSFSSPPSTSIPPSPQRSCTYHVFLSFRGEDTRKGFTDHLHSALERKGMKTFRDDKYLKTGEVISDELVKAIKESMFAIIVLSPNYASSSWCLEELRHIVECSKSRGLEVVPVFYGVEPSEVRYQKGSFEEAFKKHEKRYGEDSKRIRRWKHAMKQVANLSGMDSKDQHEATFVERIAEHIHTNMIPKLPSAWTTKFVGIKSRVEEVMGHIGIGLNDVRFIGLWGMGGIGKTTIARAVYEAIRCEFKVSRFLGNVRETCERKGIVEVQKELLSHPGGFVPYYIQNEFDGQREIQDSFCNRKVLVVLDDVNDEDQLRNLVGQQDWFGSGSRIIITTRDMHILKIHGVYQTYEVQGLVQNESFDLFCLKAFKQKNPKEGYLDLSKEVVKYCDGLPLALEVLGSHLFGRGTEVWHSAIKRIKSNPFAKIHDRLKISYDGLDDLEKNVFIDIACFFVGKKKDYVTDIFEKCGYNVEYDIDILIDRSLITIYQRSDVLCMHDLLRDMGKSIVIQESPNDSSRRSRLWDFKDVKSVLANDKGTEKIQSIVCSTHPSSFGSVPYIKQFNIFGYADRPLFRYKVECSARAFSNMTQLKLLIIDNLECPHGLLCLPTSLKVLHCLHYPLKTLPLADNQQYQLVEVKLRSSEIDQVWHGKKILPNLKYLDLSYSANLVETPDISAAPVLETLLLQSCSSLKEVHPSVAHHKNLILLDLSRCYDLRTLACKLEMSSLKELILDGCGALEDLPEFGECMKSLSRLSLKQTSIRKLPTSLGCLTGLQYLSLKGCMKLGKLPDMLDGFPMLTFLSLNYCPNLRCFPKLPSSITELKALNSSLYISDFNTSSNVCGAFVSRCQDRGHVLREMVISGSRIPSWFVHQQDGNSISIPCCDDHLNQRLGIALCFLIFDPRTLIPHSSQETQDNWVILDGYKRVVTKRKAKRSSLYIGDLYIICLGNDYFSYGFHRGTCIEFSLLRETDGMFVVPMDSATSVASAARWVRIEDIKDLN